MPSRSRVLIPAALALAAVLPAPARAASDGAGRPFAFQPYVDVGEYPPPDLGAIRRQSGVRRITLGFIDAAKGSSCRAAWDGYPEYPGTGAHAYRLTQVRTFKRTPGSDVIVSFGGAGGHELATVCPTTAALAKVYAAVIATYRVSHVDFDVEGPGETNRAANTRRARAVAELQRAAAKRGHPLVVTYTLPVDPTGLDRPGVAVARGAIAHGVRLAAVNGMAMDFGDAVVPDPAGRMGDLAIKVGNGLHRQLGHLFPALSSAAVWRRVGVTPMLGVNDVESEVFTVADARKLVSFAKAKHLGMLAMWALGRDRPCATPTPQATNVCSSTDTPAWAFSRAFGAFRG